MLIVLIFSLCYVLSTSAAEEGACPRAAKALNWERRKRKTLSWGWSGVEPRKIPIGHVWQQAGWRSTNSFTIGTGRFGVSAHDHFGLKFNQLEHRGQGVTVKKCTLSSVKHAIIWATYSKISVLIEIIFSKCQVYRDSLWFAQTRYVSQNHMIM